MADNIHPHLPQPAPLAASSVRAAPPALRVERGQYCESVVYAPSNGQPGNAVIECSTMAIPFSKVVAFLKNAHETDGALPAKLDLFTVTPENMSQKSTLNPAKLLLIDDALKKAGITNGWDLAIDGNNRDLKIFPEQQRIVMPTSLLEVPVEHITNTLGRAYQHMKKKSPVDARGML